MKKCSSCGTEAPDWVAACSNCRTLFDAPHAPGSLAAPFAVTTAPTVAQAPVAKPSVPTMAQAPVAKPTHIGPDTRKIPGIAIAALVLCFVCFPLVGSIVAIPALRKINDAPHLYKGKGLAIAALVIGGVWTAFVIVGIVAAFVFA